MHMVARVVTGPMAPKSSHAAEQVVVVPMDSKSMLTVVVHLERHLVIISRPKRGVLAVPPTVII